MCWVGISLVGNYSERCTGVLGGYQSCWLYALRGELVCWAGNSLVGNM